MAESLGRSRLTTWVELTPRSASGFRLMNMRPVLLCAPPPTKEPKPATAGSAAMMSAARCWSRSIAWNDTSGDARVPAKTRPVSSRK